MSDYPWTRRISHLHGSALFTILLKGSSLKSFIAIFQTDGKD